MNRDSHGRNLWRQMPRAESAGEPRQLDQMEHVRGKWDITMPQALPRI